MLDMFFAGLVVGFLLGAIAVLAYLRWVEGA